MDPRFASYGLQKSTLLRLGNTAAIATTLPSKIDPLLRAQGQLHNTECLPRMAVVDML